MSCIIQHTCVCHGLDILFTDLYGIVHIKETLNPNNPKPTKIQLHVLLDFVGLRTALVN